MIKVIDVKFSFEYQKIFSGLSFGLDKGKYLVISGPDKSGKTTLVKMLTGILLPDAGEILIDGEFLEEIVSSPKRLNRHRRKIGGVCGIYSLLSDRTILENISMAAEIAGVSAKIARKNAIEACGKFRLSHITSFYPDTISKLEYRAALLARAVAARKNLIIADAPTDGLDAKAARFIHEKLTSLRLSGITILYLTTGDGPENGPDSRLYLRDGRLEEC